jgi:predicted DCC family thiol-disulfide oxidoreductase YuxK
MILLYDGVCGLCNEWVQVVLDRDVEKRFTFAPLQGETAARILPRHGKDPKDLDTVYLVLDPDGPNEKVLWKGRAILTIVKNLGWPWKFLAVFSILPSGLIDFGYDFVARHRYRWFGKHESCPIPTPDQRARFRP